jgi:hypothetical protein
MALSISFASALSGCLLDRPLERRVALIEHLADLFSLHLLRL